MPRTLVAAVAGLAAGVAALVWLVSAKDPDARVPIEELCFVTEASGGPQVGCFAADGGEEALTHGPNAHFPAGAAWGGLWVVESEGEAEAHRERLWWFRREAAVSAVEMHPWASRARAPAAEPSADWLVLESGLSGFSDLRQVWRDGGSMQLTFDSEGCFEPQLWNGELRYVSSRDGNPELYALGLDGGAPRRLFEHPAEDVAPRVSALGEVAFVSNRSGVDRLYLLPPDGGPVALLHSQALEPGPRAPGSAEELERDAVWAPGGLLVFAARASGGRLRLWVFEPATKKLRALTDGQQDADQPAVSADGKWVAFASGPPRASDVAVVPLAGGTPRRVGPSAAHSRWLPRWVRWGR